MGGWFTWPLPTGTDTTEEALVTQGPQSQRQAVNGDPERTAVEQD